MKRLVVALIALVLAALALRSVAGQSMSELAGWIPADVGAYLELNVRNPDEALRGLNVGAFVGTYLQPTRTALDGVRPFDTFFPLDLLDLESASFEDLVLPWLGDSIGVAYGALELPRGGTSDEVLLILPARDPFEAAAVLSAAIEGQDLLQIEMSAGAALYIGDRAAIALTPSVALMGSESMVRAALAAQAGDTPSLAGSADYQAISAALPADSDALFFTRGEASVSALPALFSLSGEAAPLLSAYGATLQAQSGGSLPATQWLQGEVQALGVALELSAPITRQVSAQVAVLAPEATMPGPSLFDDTLLDYLPRSAMLAYTAPDTRLLADAVLAALPFAASGPGLLSALPLQPPLPAGVVPVPDAESAALVLDVLKTTLAANGLDWGAILQNVSGSGALALLPRPNNPMPVTGALADVLLVVESEDPESLAAAVVSALEAYLIAVEDDGGDGARYVVTPAGANEPVLQFAAADGVFVIGTGQSVDEALRAFAGDNRLIDQPRWERAGSPAPGLYLDIDRLYNTFLPVSGGSAPGPVNLVGITGGTGTGGVFELSARATVTLGG